VDKAGVTETRQWGSYEKITVIRRATAGERKRWCDYGLQCSPRSTCSPGPRRSAPCAGPMPLRPKPDCWCRLLCVVWA